MRNMLRVWRGVEKASADLKAAKAPEMWQWVPTKDVPKEETGCMTGRIADEDDPPADGEDDSNDSSILGMTATLLCAYLLI